MIQKRKGIRQFLGWLSILVIVYAVVAFGVHTDPFPVSSGALVLAAWMVQIGWGVAAGLVMVQMMWDWPTLRVRGGITYHAITILLFVLMGLFYLLGSGIWPTQPSEGYGRWEQFVDLLFVYGWTVVVLLDWLVLRWDGPLLLYLDSRRSPSHS
jgi:hypothetical protein